MTRAKRPTTSCTVGNSPRIGDWGDCAQACQSYIGVVALRNDRKSLAPHPASRRSLVAESGGRDLCSVPLGNPHRFKDDLLPQILVP